MRRRHIEGIARAMKILLCLFFAAVIALTLSELPLLWNGDGDYPFGWEGGGWLYSSRASYLATMLVVAALGLVGFGLVLRSRVAIATVNAGVVVSGHLLLFP